MRGLLEKDIRLLIHSKQTFVCFIALAVVLGVAQKSTFMLGYLTFFISAILVSTLSYDEMDHGFAFLFTLPINRKIYVREKYVFCMGGAVIVWSLTMMLYVIILNVRHTPAVISEEVLKGLSFLPIVIFFLSLLIPMQLKFGVEKSRLVMIGVWSDDLLFGRKKWNAGWKQRSRVVCFRLDRRSGGRCDRIAYSRCSGCGVIPVQLPYYEKERTVILTGII